MDYYPSRKIQNQKQIRFWMKMNLIGKFIFIQIDNSINTPLTFISYAKKQRALCQSSSKSFKSESPQSNVFTVSSFSSRAITREVLLKSNFCCMFSSQSTFQHGHTCLVVDIYSCPLFLRNTTLFLHSSLETSCILTKRIGVSLIGLAIFYARLVL